MTDYVVFFGLGCAATLPVIVLYVTSRFTYSITDGALVIDWHALRWIPLGRRRIPLGDIAEVRRFEASWALLIGNFLLCGNIPFEGRAVLITRAKPWYALNRAIVVTPADPDAFVSQFRGTGD